MKTMFTLPAALSFLFFLGLSVPVFAHDGAHDSKAHDTYDKMKHSEGSATKEMDSHTGGHLGQGHEYSEGSDSMNREMGHKATWVRAANTNTLMTIMKKARPTTMITKRKVTPHAGRQLKLPSPFSRFPWTQGILPWVFSFILYFHFVRFLIR